jgi:DNA-binding MarR family transcriptional regulator
MSTPRAARSGSDDAGVPSPARSLALQAVRDSGRELSTAMILFHANVAQRVGLGSTEEKVLELVQRHDRASVGELAAHAGMAKNSISDVVDRLEAKGFVERHPHPSDRRKVSVVVTTSGIDAIAEHFEDFMARLEELHEDFTTEQLAAVADYQRRAAALQLDAAHRLTSESGRSRR